MLSDNLTLALQNPTIIKKKLQEDLASRRMIQLQEPSTLLYICLLLVFVSKHDSCQQRIHHLSHSSGKSVNDYITNGARELGYRQFHEVLQLVTKVDRHYIILKKDVKDTFRNILVATQYQWLLDFN